MSSDPTDIYGLIEEIRVALNELTNDLFPLANWVVGLEADPLTEPPGVEWREQGGEIETGTTELTGGESGDIAMDASSFHVTIWRDTPQECKETLYDLVRAVRAITYGPNNEFGEYTWSSETVGRKLDVALTLRLPIKVDKDVATEIVEFHQHTTTLTIDGTPEEVC